MALAGPVVLGQLGIMLMSLVDTAMVGRLGPAAVAAVGVGNSLYAVAFMFGLGVMLGLDRVVAFAHGAGRPEDVKRALVQGVYLATLLSVPLTAAVLLSAELLDRLGVEPAVLAGAKAYVQAVAWSLWPTLAFTAVRQALQGVGDTKMATLVLLVANVVNLGGNALFIGGGLGLPALGVAGSGWATLVSRLFMCGALALYARRRLGPEPLPLALDVPMLRELVRLGLPAGVQLVFEGGVFSLVTLLAAKLGAVPGAAHQIVLQVASFTFMVPLGISSAGSVRVGQALGRGEPAQALRAGWAAVALGMAFMLLSGLTLVVLARPILAIFRQPQEVVTVARQLLLCAGLFQVFDGAQVTLAGVLRGANDTLSSMVTNIVGHWLVGLPVGYALCYVAGWGTVGLWIGLATGLAVVAAALAVVWQRHMTQVARVAAVA